MAEAAARKPHAARKGKGGSEDEMKGVAPDVALQLMRRMLLFRRFEEKAEEAYAIGKIAGFCHLHIGQEASAAGCVFPLRESDYVISSYREHTHALAKGISPKAVMAELFGRVDGCSGGRGGSMHLFDLEKGFMGGNAIIIFSAISVPVDFEKKMRLNQLPNEHGNATTLPEADRSLETQMGMIKNEK